MSKQISAVEWLIEQLTATGQLKIAKGSNAVTSIIEQAKEMEKEQISEAYRTGVEEDVYLRPLRTGEQYYNETFKSE
jgi:hypothetical protein